LYGRDNPAAATAVIEGRLLQIGMRALELGTNVVIDFGLWSRDERSALRSLAASAGGSGRVVYLPVEPEVQRLRIAERQAAAPDTTFPMTAADLDRWRGQFQPPDAAELVGADIPPPSPGWPGWADWAAHRWPGLPDQGDRR
jgi:predicted kinase